MEIITLVGIGIIIVLLVILLLKKPNNDGLKQELREMENELKRREGLYIINVSIFYILTNYHCYYKIR